MTTNLSSPGEYYRADEYYRAAEAITGQFEHAKALDRRQAAWAYYYRMQWLRAAAHLWQPPGLSEEQFERFYDDDAVSKARKSWPKRRAQMLGHV